MRIFILLFLVLSSIIDSFSQEIRLDSVLYEYISPEGTSYHAEHYIYENNGDKITTTLDNPFSDNIERIILEKSNDGSMKTKVLQEYHSELGSFINSEKEVYEIFHNYNRLENYRWNNEISDWVGSSLEMKYINNQKNIDSIINYKWNKEINNWQLSDYKQVFSYDSLNRIVRADENSRYDVYEYNDWGVLISIKTYSKYDNDLGNNLIFEYDSSGNILKKTWDNISRIGGISYFTYDSLNNLTSEKNINLPDELNLIEYHNTIVYDYTTPIDKVNIEGYYSGFNSQFIYRPITITYLSQGLNEDKVETHIYKGTFYYSDIVLSNSLIEKENNKSAFYPNPASSTLQVSEEVLKTNILDLYGKPVLKSDLKTIDVSELSNGSYILLLETGKGVTTEKLIISK